MEMMPLCGIFFTARNTENTGMQKNQLTEREEKG